MHNARMYRAIFSIVVAAMAAGPSLLRAGQISAYEAMISVGRAKGDALLANLVEVRGVDAAPQPAQWTLSFKDASARGGIREFVVNDKGISAERTPLQTRGAGSSGTMAATALKLNSTGVFTAANAEAAKAKLGFNTLDYRLRNKGGVPVWLVRLSDVDGNEVGVIEFSAKDGTIVTPLRPAVAPAASSRPRTAAPPGPVAAAPSPDKRPLGQRWVEGGGLVGHVDRWGRRTWKTTSETAERTWQSTGETAERVGDTIEAFFTGRPPQETKPGN